MDNTGNTNQPLPTDQTPTSLRRRKTLRAIGFLALLIGFFSVGFYLIGPLLQESSAPKPPSAVELTKDEEWGQAPAIRVSPKEPVAPVSTSADVQVSEIAPGSTEAPATSAPPPATQLTPNVEIPVETSQRAPSPAATEPQRVPAPQPKITAPAPQRFTVQAGIFANRTNAQTVAASLADQGYGATIRQLVRNNETHYQVIVGNPRDRTNAEKLATELRDAGRDVTVVPAD
jgi:cell division protein FtsN